MRKLLLTLLMLGSLCYGDGDEALADCPQIDKSKLDVDGMPFCPGIVETRSAYAVYSCAIAQARSFHTPTEDERRQSADMLQAFKLSVEQGLKPETTIAFLNSAASLGLQACRVKKVVNGAVASYRLVYTKPGVQDYSGAFFMLRETKASKVVIIGPHDGSDGTYASTKKGLSETAALATISNGRKRNGEMKTDFVHSTDNLGTVQVRQFFNLFPASVVLHVHGMKATDKVMYRSRTPVLGKAFEDGIRKGTKLEKFVPFNADFSIDPMVNTNWYLKTEIPAQTHQNNKMVIAVVVREIEKHGWAWADKGLAPVLEKVVVTPVVVPATLPPPAYKYAPRPKPVAGTKTLTCIAIVWKDQKQGATAQQCKNVVNSTAAFFKTSSRGLLVLKPSGAHAIKVDLNHAAKNLYPAEKLVIAKVPKADMYQIINNNVRNYSNAGKGVAHLQNPLLRTAHHEVGHLLGLDHAGVYKKDGQKWELDAYGDGKSVMGKFPSETLTAPQYYAQGWLREDEVAMYEPGNTYDLRRINDFDGTGLAAVLVSAELFKGGGNVAEVNADDDVEEEPTMAALKAKPRARDAFVSVPPGCEKACFAIHLSSRGGSQQIITHHSEYYDEHFTGLHVKIVDFNKGNVKVMIDFKPKPVVVAKK